MKRMLFLFLAASPFLFAQGQASGQIRIAVASGAATGGVAPIPGAPFSATLNNKSIQTLADGNQIVQTSAGMIARDSQGRTRQELPTPTVGQAGSEAPRLVLIQDPVAGMAYTLDLTHKTAREVSLSSSAPANGSHVGPEIHGFAVRVGSGNPAAGPLLSMAIVDPKSAAAADEEDQASTEDLGSQTLEGLLVNGVRTTRTIPAGQIGNAEPITIVTEVWISSELKTVVSSKRTDPIAGDDTFALSNISRDEPAPSLFVVPSDFKIVDDSAGDN
jgi:hypothetical protein